MAAVRAKKPTITRWLGNHPTALSGDSTIWRVPRASLGTFTSAEIEESLDFWIVSDSISPLEALTSHRIRHDCT